jgi:tetratricopeptide (TPR) repeat protein
VRKLSATAVVGSLTLCLLAGETFPQQQTQFESLLASAQQAQARSDFQSAAGYYSQAVALHPEIPELRANLGLMYYQTGKDEKAIDAFREAIRLKPTLFVPNLFLGLDYLKLKRLKEAIPPLKQAAISNPADIQPQLGLAQAYAGTGNTRLAIGSYLQASKIDPAKADTWYHLGVSYLEQVESDARILFTRHRNSAYLQALIADTFSEQRALIQSDQSYKELLAMPKFPASTHASYGFVLSTQHDLAGAERQFNAELVTDPGSLMAKLGLARLHLEQGATEESAKEIENILKTDAGFLRSNIVRFNAGLPQEKRAELKRALDERRTAGEISDEFATLFPTNIVENPGPQPSSPDSATRVQSTKLPISKAAGLYANGRYGDCTALLASRFALLQAKDLQLLASCAYSTGDHQNAFAAATKLAANLATEPEGLYWETKSAQKLATAALARASELDSSSPKLHVLLGDIYRQRKSFPDAEQEYRKALALKPDDTGALFGLSLALLADDQTDEALRQVQAALEKNLNDPELNAVMGEILCARGDFAGAEGYLKKSLNTKPEYVPHVHALLGKVYAQTNRTQQAISELKLALPGDKDGHLHYQIARLYLKVGDQGSAKQAFEVSARIRREGLTRAAVAMQQGEDETEPQ